MCNLGRFDGMDLLCTAYANVSDDDKEEEDVSLPISPAKKRRLEGHSLKTVPFSPVSNHDNLPSGVPGHYPAVEGRYVSKRERAILSASSMPTNYSSPAIASSDLSGDSKALLKCQGSAYALGNKISENLPLTLKGHCKAVNTIQWSHNHAHLLASAGMDQSVIVWNVWNNKTENKVCIFNHHKAAVTDVRWCPQGLFLLSCGYDSSSRLIDVEKGVETQQFCEDQVVQSIKFQPTNSNLFLSGGSKGVLRLWDIRANNKKVVHEYRRHLGPVLDVEFSTDGKHFISSTDTSRSNISENSIIVWDVSRQIPLSNQVYGEGFTCPCVRYHPWEASFVGQSNGNYIAIFSGRAPFRMDKYRRFEGGHGVWGYPIKCHFSPDGRELASGSSDGSACFYHYPSSRLLRKFRPFHDDHPCLDVAFHPSFPNLFAASSSIGHISLLQF